jgi:hypothetical protein
MLSVAPREATRASGTALLRSTSQRRQAAARMRSRAHTGFSSATRPRRRPRRPHSVRAMSSRAQPPPPRSRSGSCSNLRLCCCRPRPRSLPRMEYPPNLTLMDLRAASSASTSSTCTTSSWQGSPACREAGSGGELGGGGGLQGGGQHGTCSSCAFPAISTTAPRCPLNVPSLRSQRSRASASPRSPGPRAEEQARVEATRVLVPAHPTRVP